MKILVFYSSIVFFVFGCGTAKKSVVSHSTKTDSLIYKETVKLDTIRIPYDRVSVVVDNESLKLKDKEIQDLNYQFLKYKQASGSRANVQFKLIRDSIYIEGTCDSGEILSLRKTIDKYKSSESKYEKLDREVKQKGYGIINLIITAVISFIAGMAVYKILKFTRIV